MFIAVINENFEVAEAKKKEEQASKYWSNQQAHQVQESSSSWLHRLNPYRWVKASPVKVKVDNLPRNLILPMQKSIIQDYSMPRYEERPTTVSTPIFFFVITSTTKINSTLSTFLNLVTIRQSPLAPLTGSLLEKGLMMYL